MRDGRVDVVEENGLAAATGLAKAQGGGYNCVGEVGADVDDIGIVG